MWRTLISPKSPPYDPLSWVKLPLKERAQQVCHAWILQGFGAPLSIYAFYLLKMIFYVAMWIFFCGYSSQLGSWSTIEQWYLHPLAFQKAILWSMLFEGLGLGCGSGPLTARYIPPMGGMFYTLRVGTVKLPLFPKVAGIGRDQRGWIEVILYLLWIVGMSVLLCSDQLESNTLLQMVILVGVLGILDKMLFLMMRAEHYWVLLICMYVSGDQTHLWFTWAMLVHCALWFWAGISKLNAHFPTVVAVMLSNHPLNHSQKFRKLLYKNYPHDVRPSTLTVIMSHMGTALELGTPILFIIAAQVGTNDLNTSFFFWAAIICSLQLHLFITSNVPMGVPIEWNVIMIYGVFALFIPHSQYLSFDHIYTSMSISWVYIVVMIFLSICLIVLPLLGNLYPRWISFLISMRYYAGNWPYSIYLFKGDSYRKIHQNLTCTAPWVDDQLAYLYDQKTITGVVGRVMGFRMMHLQGRLLSTIIPKAITQPLADYTYVEGEVLAGLTIGWNFGDGHLHQEQLLQSLQKRCQFESGELRCIFVESQPLGRDTMNYRIYDACDGVLEQDVIQVSALQKIQPWESLDS